MWRWNTWTVVELSYLKVLVCPFSRNTFNTLGMNGTHDSNVDIGQNNGDPFITTPSANRTLEGLFLSLAFFAAVRRADFRVDYWHKRSEEGWEKTIEGLGIRISMGRMKDMANRIRSSLRTLRTYIVGVGLTYCESDALFTRPEDFKFKNKDNDSSDDCFWRSIPR